MKIYITSDRIGGQTGAGHVCENELEALRNLDHEDTLLINPTPNEDPFDSDRQALDELKKHDLSKATLCHIYAGTYPKTVQYLKSLGVKVCTTAAAHDREESIKEHKAYGITLPNHLTDDLEFNKYLESYLKSDLIICPSTHSANQMKKFGCQNVEVIPHGCHSMQAKAYPKTFNVGYLGQIGPDKGIRYLLEAWAELNYKNAVLNLAGSQTPYLLNLIRYYGIGNVIVHGWVDNVQDFYNSLSVYVQPSVTEGFGIETLEALGCGRPVICSEGAGSADITRSFLPTFEPRDSKKLAECIDSLRQSPFNDETCIQFQQVARSYDWNFVRQHYIKTWSKLKGE